MKNIFSGIRFGYWANQVEIITQYNNDKSYIVTYNLEIIGRFYDPTTSDFDPCHLTQIAYYKIQE